jgi:hypothetical protein
VRTGWLFGRELAEMPGSLGPFWGRKRADLRTKIDKKREKSIKNDEDFEVDLLIAKELSSFLR